MNQNGVFDRSKKAEITKRAKERQEEIKELINPATKRYMNQKPLTLSLGDVLVKALNAKLINPTE